MSLLGFDGFTAYANLNDLANSSNWVRETDNGNAAIVLAGGQNERGGFRVGGNNRLEEEWYFDIGSLKTELTIGFWFKFEGFDSTDDLDDIIISFRSSTTYRASFLLAADGSIQFRRTNTGFEYFDSSDPLETSTGTPLFLFQGGEYKIEIKISLINTTGSVELRVDGEQWFINEGGIDADGTANRVYFETGALFSGASYQISDFWIIEDDGTDPVGFLGQNFQVELLTPTGESGTESDFTPSSGTDNHLMVDDGNSHDADGTYVESTVNTDIDRYTTTDTLNQARVLGVNVISVARHLGSADNYRNTIFENATAGNGGTEALTESYLPYHYLSTINPDTSAEWDPTDLEGAEFGVENMA